MSPPTIPKRKRPQGLHWLHPQQRKDGTATSKTTTPRSSNPARVVKLFFLPSHSGMNSSNKYEENKETRLHCWTWLQGLATELCPSVELRRLGGSHSHLHHHDSFLVFLGSLLFFNVSLPFASREWCVCDDLHASETFMYCLSSD